MLTLTSFLVSLGMSRLAFSPIGGNLIMGGSKASGSASRSISSPSLAPIKHCAGNKQRWLDLKVTPHDANIKISVVCPRILQRSLQFNNFKATIYFHCQRTSVLHRAHGVGPGGVDGR
jgi:hypothetical protein